MVWFAHSPKQKGGVDYPAQTYGEHITNVRAEAERSALNVVHRVPQAKAVVSAVTLAAEFHDLGKLDDKNQEILSGRKEGALQVDHVDAGVAHLLTSKTSVSVLAALLVYSHHRGLPDFVKEGVRGAMCFRGEESEDNRPPRFGVSETVERTEAYLISYLERHCESVPTNSASNSTHVSEILPVDPLLYRIGLGCLADADHGDTARHYGAPVSNPPQLLTSARLTALRAYVARMRDQAEANGVEPVRIQAREALFTDCLNADTKPAIYACDSPVGTGKTTAIMAHLLRAAEDKEKNLRRIFIVLPFTNIIDQSVDTYRKALTLPGEDPTHVVAAHHHKTDLADPLRRELTTRWQAPVVVTTAVQFFETLASNMPAELRKLHQVPGSAIFIDEAHAALPARLWPLAWHWLRKLADDWGCHIVLGSGSLNEFWRLQSFYERGDQCRNVPHLVPLDLRQKLSALEKQRVELRFHQSALSLDGLIDFTLSLKGPRIVVLNTVQSAAVAAHHLAQRVGRERVCHLSTALTPKDRGVRLKEIKSRLDSRDVDSDWTLVATSLVEAGIDISFHSGIRESAGLTSLLQLAGRVSRDNEYDDAVVWSVNLTHDKGLAAHPKLETATRVLSRLANLGRATPEYCTEALQQEVTEDDASRLVSELFSAERNNRFPDVQNNFKVIDQKTVTAIVNSSLVERLRFGRYVDWKELQEHSVQIWPYKIDTYALKPIDGSRYPLYEWVLGYDDFLGVMKDVVSVEANRIVLGYLA